MNYKLCPNCELNYLKDDEELCSVCLNNSEENVLAIVLNINLDFQRFIDSKAHGKLTFDDLDFDVIYQRTRSRWSIADERQKKIKTVVSVINGIIFGVWIPFSWNKVFDSRTNKWKKEFDGIKAEDSVFDEFFGRNISSLISQGEQNPIKYFTQEQIKKCPLVQKK